MKALYIVTLFTRLSLVTSYGLRDFLARGSGGSTEGPPTTPEEEEVCVDWKDLADTLAANQATWEASDLSSCYKMTISRSCFCPTEYREPRTITVLNGEIQEDVDKIYQRPTMEELFALIDKDCVQKCPNNGPAECRVTFADDKDGAYITSLYIDYSRFIADEENSYTVSSLEAC